MQLFPALLGRNTIKWSTCLQNVPIMLLKLFAGRVVKGESGVQSHSDLDGVGSIPAIPNARYVPSLLCHERFNEASLPRLHILHICSWSIGVSRFKLEYADSSSVGVCRFKFKLQFKIPRRNTPNMRKCTGQNYVRQYAVLCIQAKTGEFAHGASPTIRTNFRSRHATVEDSDGPDWPRPARRPEGCFATQVGRAGSPAAPRQAGEPVSARTGRSGRPH
jgi:hypothetical protein